MRAVGRARTSALLLTSHPTLFATPQALAAKFLNRRGARKFAAQAKREELVEVGRRAPLTYLKDVSLSLEALNSPEASVYLSPTETRQVLKSLDPQALNPKPDPKSYSPAPVLPVDRCWMLKLLGRLC